MPQLLKFTAPDRAQEGDAPSGCGQVKGGWSTKILGLTDALGNLVRFVLLPGNRYDTVGVAPLIKGPKFDAQLGNIAHDSDWMIKDMNALAASICISQRPQRKEPLEIDPVINV